MSTSSITILKEKNNFNLCRPLLALFPNLVHFLKWMTVHLLMSSYLCGTANLKRGGTKLKLLEILRLKILGSICLRVLLPRGWNNTFRPL